MKMYLLLALAAIAVVAVLAACNAKKKAETSAKKYLVLYYSQTGATKAVAEELQKVLGADIERIEAEVPYDGDYQQTIDRCRQEMDSNLVPKVKPLKANIAEYDVVFIGYPVWFGTYARPVMGLLADCDLTDKKVVPFCTFGSGGLEPSVADLKKAQPQAEVLEGYGVRNARLAAMPKEVDRFLKECGFIEGEVEPLADYSEQQPVTDAERAVFDAACGDYQFPLGTPETVGSRKTADGTDYKYSVKGTTPDGKETTATIYVTVGNAPDAKPEFTRVTR